MDEASQPQPLSMGQASGGAMNSARMQQRGGQQGGAANYSIQNELMWIKQDAIQVRNAVILLEQEKDSLRKAIRKLKLENGRVKLKVKSLQEQVNQLTGNTTNGVQGASEADLDYDDIGRDFLLIGGVHDPLSLRHEVVIRADDGVEHKSAERYYWYKMAEKFDDQEAAKKILTAPNVNAAEAAMKEIKNFDEEVWNKEKLQHWEDGQLLKLKQVRAISNLLVYSQTTYIAVASQDKCFGTGWRKNREESNKPIFWDGLNEGGKILMKIRQQLKEGHTWLGPQEEEETQKKFKELQRYVWRRIDPTKRIQAGPTRGPVGPRGRVMSAGGPRRAPQSGSNGNGRPSYNAGAPGQR
uniref:NADAR domain-containing protein n=1 Tax=Ditylenchus dipsaci TaxID=166011 RepID=A0A915DWN1_9BILA